MRSRSYDCLIVGGKVYSVRLTQLAIQTTNLLWCRVPLTSPLGTPQVDDTLFTTAASGFMLVSDTPANTGYAVKKQFAPGDSFSAGVAASSTSSTSIEFVARLDLESGRPTPVVSGMQSAHGWLSSPLNPIRTSLTSKCGQF